MPITNFQGLDRRPLPGKLSGFAAIAGIWVLWHFATPAAWWHYVLMVVASVAIMLVVGAWWFMNDEAPGSATFYYKYVRNPAQNFRWYVIGLVDRPHRAWGWPQADLNQRSDLRPPEVGFTFAAIYLLGIPLLPYISYSSPGLTGYIGWQASGGFGIKLNFSNGDYAEFKRETNG